MTKAASEGLSDIAYGHNKQMPPQNPYQPRRNASQSSKNSISNRTSSVWNFNDQDLFPVYKLGYLPSVPLHGQESMLVDELMHCMVGVRGTYIVPAEGSLGDDLAEVRFNISEKVDVSLRDLASQVGLKQIRLICIFIVKPFFNFANFNFSC